MAQVILNRNFFCGYRIRKSPNKKTPVYVPNEFVRFLPRDAVVVSMEEEDMPDVDRNRPSLQDFDYDRKAENDMFEKLQVAEKEAVNHLFTSVSIITADAQELIGRFSLDKDKIEGTGKEGRITKADVERYMEAMNGH